MFVLLVTNADILNVLGKNLKQARKKLKYTQEFVAENVDISIDLLRNIENGRNIGSVPTLLGTFKGLSKKDRDVLKNIIIHLDKNY